MAERFAGLALAALTCAGWLLLLYVILALPVSSGTQSLFYAAGFIAIAGSAALLSTLYQARRNAAARTSPMARIGGSMRFAFAVEFALWLQSLRVLTAAYLVFIIGGFIFVEVLFRHASSERRASRE